MGRKSLGVLIAVALAAVGTVALVSFVRNAEERARAGEEMVEVYVVQEAIPAGTIADDITDLVDIELVPAKVQAAGSVQSLSGLSGQVTSVELLAGEQLVRTRFVEPASFSNRAQGVIIPEGMLELTIALDPQRVIGGLLEPGDTVSIFGSYEAAQVQTSGVIEIDGQQVAIPDSLAEDQEVPSLTKLLLQKVLVTAVQDTPQPGGFNDDDEVSRLEEAPLLGLYVTLAVDTENAERVVFTQEFGRIWLAQERPDVSTADSGEVTRDNVLEEPTSVLVRP